MESRSKAGMRPIFIIFQVLGLYPLSNQIINTIYTIASISVGFWMMMSFLVISSVFVNGSLRIFMGHIIFIIRAIVPMLVIAQSYLTRSAQTQIFLILNKIDRSFEENFAKNINYKRLRMKYLVAFFGPISALVATRMYFLNHLMYHKDVNFRFYWLHCVQSLLVSRTRCMQVAFYANLINDRIQWIHEELNRIGRRKHRSQKKITFLRQIYASIYDASVLINQSFGWSLLTITISYFVDYVGNCYMYLLVVQNILRKEDKVSSSVGLISSSMALFTLCYSCGRCADNASATYGLIGKLINSKTVGTSDHGLEGILLQVYHQNVVVTGNDFFKNDMNLLIISATITYIIVIIQS